MALLTIQNSYMGDSFGLGYYYLVAGVPKSIGYILGQLLWVRNNWVWGSNEHGGTLLYVKCLPPLKCHTLGENVSVMSN